MLAALAPAALLAVDPGGWHPFGPVKWLAVSTLVPAGVALVLARRPVRLAAGPTAAAGALVGWLALAAALGRDGLYAWLGTPERHLGVLAWALAALALVAGQALGDDRDRRVVAGGLVVAGLGLGLAAAAEASGWEPAVLDAGSRLSGLVGSPAYLGAAAALLLPALAGLAADPTWDRRVRAAAGTGAVGLAVAALGSGARAAWVGLVAAATVTAWAGRARLARACGWAALAAAVAAAGIAVVAVAGPVGARVAGTFDPGEPGGRGRLDEWRVAVRVATDHPVAGVGPEGYRIAFSEGVDAAYERAHGRDPLPDRAHTTPLDVSLAGGVPALAAWLALVLLAGRAVLVALRSERPWLAGIGAGLVAHVVGSLFLFPVIELEPVAWLLAGVLLAAAPTTSASRARQRAAPRPVPVVLGLVAAAALLAGVADVAADRYARRSADALAAGDGSAAASASASALRLRPDQVRLHLLDGRARVADEQGIVAGLEAVDGALAISSGDPVARRERARLLVARAEATRAPAHVDTARDEVGRMLARDPVDSTLWALAAVAHELDGDRAAAGVALRRAEELRPGSRDGT